MTDPKHVLLTSGGQVETKVSSIPVACYVLFLNEPNPKQCPMAMRKEPVLLRHLLVLTGQ